MTFSFILLITSFKVETTMVNYDFRMHKHAFSELVVIVGGKGKHLVNSYVFDLSPGDVFVIKGSIAHGFSNAYDLELINFCYMDDIFFSIGRLMWNLQGFQQFFIIPLACNVTAQHTSFYTLTMITLFSSSGCLNLWKKNSQTTVWGEILQSKCYFSQLSHFYRHVSSMRRPSLNRMVLV